MSQDMAKRQSADQPTVKEEIVAASGMPMDNASMMAQQMAPKTSMTENTGIASMMPRELPSEEEPMKMSYGGVLNSRSMVMGQPLMSSMRPMAETFPPRMQQQRDNLGFNNLGSNIVDRIGEKSQGEVDEFIGEVRDMADERFDLDLTPEPQFDTGGKGFPPALRPMISQKPNIPQGLIARITTAQPMYRKEGGPIKAQSGMFADIRGAITGADAPSFSMPPAFASIYNYAKTVLGLDDELARDVANKTIQQDNLQTGMFRGLGREYDDVKASIEQKQALDTFTGGAEMDQLVNQLNQPKVQDVDNVPDLNLTGSLSEKEILSDPKTFKGPIGAGIGPEIGDEDFKLELDRIKSFVPKMPDYKPSDSPVGKGSSLMRIDLEEPFTQVLNKSQEKLSPIVSRESTDLLGDASDTSGKLPMTDMPAKKDDEDDVGTGTGLGGGLGGSGSALSELEAQIDKLKSDREKGRQSEKWFALAEVGLGMLASQSPTVLGALGEGGLRGLKSFREGKKDYDKDMLSYLTTKASIQKTRGDQAIKSAYYQGVLENARAKAAKSGFTQKDLLNSIKDKDKIILDYQTKYPTTEKPKDYERKLLNMKAERQALFERLETEYKPLVVNPPYDATKVN
jgi:hypothetical protein